MKAVKTIFFHLLSPFRGLIKLICKVLSVLLIFSALSGFFMLNDPHWMHISFSVVMAGAFSAISWYFDSLLLWLSPDDVVAVIDR